MVMGHDSGAATAEFAVVLPVVMVLALLITALSRTVIISMNCQDAAALVARELVVSGEDVDAGALARSVAGEGVETRISRENDAVHVVTHCPVLPGPLNVLPTRVSGQATGVG